MRCRSLARNTARSIEPRISSKDDERKRRVARRNTKGNSDSRFRLARTVECDGLANERLEGGLVHFFSFVDVDRAACVFVETRVEETLPVLQRRAFGEGQLHDMLVGFAGADDAVVRPNRSAGSPP